MRESGAASFTDAVTISPNPRAIRGRLRAAEYTQAARAAVIGDLQYRSHSNHKKASVQPSAFNWSAKLLKADRCAESI
jgi:hypothetical protein